MVTTYSTLGLPSSCSLSTVQHYSRTHPSKEGGENQESHVSRGSELDEADASRLRSLSPKQFLHLSTAPTVSFHLSSFLTFAHLPQYQLPPTDRSRAVSSTYEKVFVVCVSFPHHTGISTCTQSFSCAVSLDPRNPFLHFQILGLYTRRP